MTTAQKLMTADELLLMPRDKNDCSFELVRGVLTEPVPPHFNPHGIASARFGFGLTKYTVDTDVGVVTGRAGFHLEENPDTVRAPDIGWVAPGRIVEGSTSGYLRLAPDLAVETKESYETQRDMAERAAMWLDFGTQMVWVGDPERTTVTRYRPGQAPVTLYEDDVLDGGDLLPGFSIPFGACSAGIGSVSFPNIATNTFLHHWSTSMPTFDSDGVHIFYQSTGEGFPLIWSHEFAGSYESWEQQVRYFSHRYRVITYNDRGYPPSDVPTDPEAYSQDVTIEDLRRLMDHLGLEQAYVGGLSMGGNVALNFALRYPERCRAIIVASAGSGTTHNDAFRAGGEAMASRLLAEGTPPVMKDYGSGPTRVQLQRKDPHGYDEFMRLLLSHNARGSAYTFRGVQLKRPTIDQLIPQMNACQVPTLILIGDEDDPCVEPSIMIKRHVPRSGLAVLPQCGHAINLEEPAMFNQLVSDFLTAVEAGKWAAHPLGDTPYSTGSR